MNRLTVFALSVASLAGLAWVAMHRESPDPSLPKSGVDRSAMLEKPAFVGATFVRHFSWSTYALPRRITLEDQALVAGVWEKSVHTFSTSYDIVDVCSQSKDRLYVLGTSLRNGTLVHVIERWDIVPAVSAFGAPPALEANRTQLYRDASLGGLRFVEADPDDRFLMLLRDSGSGSGADLLQLNLATMAANVIFSNSYGYEMMGAFQHQFEGRIWLVHTPSMGWVATLYDQANDGVFESTHIMDYDTWKLLDLEADIVDNFVFE